MRRMISVAIGLVVAIGLLLVVCGAVAMYGQGTNNVYVQFARQTAATQFTLPVPLGMENHTVTIQATGSMTGLTTLVEADTGGGHFVQIGTSTLLADTVTWVGAYTVLRITYSNVTGAGQIDGGYFGTPR